MIFLDPEMTKRNGLCSLHRLIRVFSNSIEFHHSISLIILLDILLPFLLKERVLKTILYGLSNMHWYKLSIVVDHVVKLSSKIQILAHI